MTSSHAKPTRRQHLLTVAVAAAACGAVLVTRTGSHSDGPLLLGVGGNSSLPHNAFVEWAPSPRCANITACAVPPPDVPPAAAGLRYLYLLSPLVGSHPVVHRRLGVELASRGASVLALHPDEINVAPVVDPAIAARFTTATYKGKRAISSLGTPDWWTRWRRTVDTLAYYLGILPITSNGIVMEALATECDALLADADALHKVARFQPDFVLGDAMDPCVAILSERLNVARAEVAAGAYPWGSRWGSDWLLNVDTLAVPAPYSPRMPPRSIVGAFQNVAAHGVQVVLDRLLVAPYVRRLHRKHGVDLTLSAARARTALLVINADPAWEHTLALPPGVVLAGSIMAGPGDPLPPDLAAWTAAAAARGDRVIYCAIGSFFKLQPEQAAALVSGLAALPRVSVLIKLSADEMDDAAIAAQPANVRVVRWAPQNDLLASGAISLFVTHGGASSIGESIYHGVPMVVMPQCGHCDQVANAVKVAAAGLGVALKGYTHPPLSVVPAVTAAMSNIDTLTARARAAQARARVARPTGASVAAAAIERAALLGLGARAPLLGEVDG